MTDVIAWPPVGLTGWQIADAYPQSRSTGLIDGVPYYSAFGRSRRFATAVVTGMGPDQAGSGFMRMLSRQWGTAPRLVRVDCFSAVWRLSRRSQNLRNGLLEWVDGAIDMQWTDGAAMLWGDGQYALSGEPTTDGSFSSINVEGLPPNEVVALPSETVTVRTATASEVRLCLTTARSNDLGQAVIRVDAAFTLTGLVSIGEAESVVFEVPGGIPKSVQPVVGTWGFTLDCVERFEDEYADGWTEVDPWR